MMGGRRRLRADAPRLLGRHDGAAGRAYRRAYDTLAAELGPLTSSLLRFEGGRAALAMVNLEVASAALAAARRAREQGRGRRPSPREIERLQRRQALQDQTYSATVDRLRDLVERHRPKLDLARRIAAGLPWREELRTGADDDDGEEA
jgi:hypothetical protein